MGKYGKLEYGKIPLRKQDDSKLFFHANDTIFNNVTVQYLLSPEGGGAAKAHH